MRWVIGVLSCNLVLGLLLLLPSCGGGTSQTTTQPPPPPAKCASAPYFPCQQGWLGADGAYSVPLGNGTSLWIFADTFVGPATATSGSPSASASLCGGKFAVKPRYTIKKDELRPVAIFERGR